MCLSSANVIILLRPSPPPFRPPPLVLRSTDHMYPYVLNLHVDFWWMYDERGPFSCLSMAAESQVFCGTSREANLWITLETPRSVVEKFASKEETGRVTDSRDFLMPTDPTDSNDATEWSTLPKVSDMVHRSFWIHCMQSSVQKENEMVFAIWSLPRSFWEIHIAHIIYWDVHPSNSHKWMQMKV